MVFFAISEKCFLFHQSSSHRVSTPIYNIYVCSNAVVSPLSSTNGTFLLLFFGGGYLFYCCPFYSATSPLRERRSYDFCFPPKRKEKVGDYVLLLLREKEEGLILSFTQKNRKKGRFRCVTWRRGIFGMTFTGFSVKFGRVGVWGGGLERSVVFSNHVTSV